MNLIISNLTRVWEEVVQNPVSIVLYLNLIWKINKIKMNFFFVSLMWGSFVFTVFFFFSVNFGIIESSMKVFKNGNFNSQKACK